MVIRDRRWHPSHQRSPDHDRENGPSRQGPFGTVAGEASRLNLEPVPSAESLPHAPAPPAQYRCAHQSSRLCRPCGPTDPAGTAQPDPDAFSPLCDPCASAGPKRCRLARHAPRACPGPGWPDLWSDGPRPGALPAPNGGSAPSGVIRARSNRVIRPLCLSVRSSSALPSGRAFLRVRPPADAAPARPASPFQGAERLIRCAVSMADALLFPGSTARPMPLRRPGCAHSRQEGGDVGRHLVHDALASLAAGPSAMRGDDQVGNVRRQQSIALTSSSTRSQSALASLMKMPESS